MKKLFSELACVIYIGKVQIVPEMNELSDEDFTTLSKTKEYPIMVEKRKFVPMDDNMGEALEESGEPKEVKDMNVAELKAYAKELGLEGLSTASKADIVSAITEALED